MTEKTKKKEGETPAPSGLTLKLHTAADAEEGREILLPCGMIASVLPAWATPELANALARSTKEIGGKKALSDSSRMVGAKGVKGMQRVYARHSLKCLRNPKPGPLTLQGFSANGGQPVYRTWESGKIESEVDKLWVMETFPQVYMQVGDAIDQATEAADDETEAIEGN